MRAILIASMLLLTAIAIAPTASADGGCEAEVVHYCIDADDPVGTVKAIVQDIRDSPCTCPPPPQPW